MRVARSSSWILVMTLVASGAGPARAQRCFRGRPLPACRSYVLTEAGYAVRLGGGDARNAHVSLVLGYMWNLSARDAVGPSVLFGGFPGGAFEPQVGLAPRYRRWITRDVSLNLSAGPLLYRRTTGPSDTWALGLTGELGVDFTDRASVFSRLELTDRTRYYGDPDWPTFQEIDRTEPGTAVYLGLRLGSKPAAYFTGAVGLLLGLAVALCAGGGCGLN